VTSAPGVRADGGARLPAEGDAEPTRGPRRLRPSRRSALRLTLTTLVVFSATFLFTATAALAATPEIPATLRPERIAGTEATLSGALNPKAEGEAGSSYEFLYRETAAKTGCEGGSKAPEPAGLSLGVKAELVSEPVSGLKEHTEYSVCLAAEDAEKKHRTVGPSVTFITGPLETPETQPATAVTATAATFHGLLNPLHEGEPSIYTFAYKESSTECEGKETAEIVALGHRAESVEATVVTLLPDTTYTFCVHNFRLGPPFEFTEGSMVTFTTPVAAPTIAGEIATAIGATTATVSSQIAPGALPTRYHVEYLTEAQFNSHGWSEATRVPTSDAELAAARTPVPVREELGGLQPGTPYRFRFVASNSLAEAGIVGEDAKFTTATSGASTSGLPDGRVYELVSTSGNLGELYAPEAPEVAIADIATERPFQAAVDGHAVAYVGEPAASGGNGGTGAGEGNEWLATRTSTGWTTSVITPQSESETSYLTFSRDLSTGILETSVQPPLTPDAPANCEALYSRASGSGTYRALFTTTNTPGNCGGPGFAGASAGEVHVIFQSEAALTEGAQEATELPPGHAVHHGNASGAGLGSPCEFGCNLYDSVAGKLRLVNFLPEGQAVANATFGGYASGTKTKPDFSNAISADGSHIFWTDTQAGPNFEHVYVRENATSTVKVSGEAAAEYWTATPDGRYAFYTEGGILYRFDTETEERLPITSAPYTTKGHGDTTSGSTSITALTVSAGEFKLGQHVFGQGIPIGTTVLAVSAGSIELSQEAVTTGTTVALSSGGPEVQGVIATNQTGPDGTYLYYVAEDGELATAGAPGVNGQPNLYLRHETGPNESTTTLIATLATADNEQLASPLSGEEGGDWVPNLGNRTAEVTPDGLHLIFESTRSLTGYNNAKAVAENAGGVEVFTYDAATGRTACASCNPSGAPPEIPEQRLSTLLPVSSGSDTYMRRWISADGRRVFFETKQPLVSADRNQVRDVYEWEQEGTPGCPVATSLYGGCVFLLSGGNSNERSFLIDADAAGDNVFFTHRGQLGNAEGTNGKNELYDARVNGGFPQTTLACSGTGCQGVPPAPPLFATPSSVTFNGAGNYPPQAPPKGKTAAQLRAEKLAKALKACRKKHGKRMRLGCERQARKRYSPARTARRSANASRETRP
jgi:hypothetical protein